MGMWNLFIQKKQFYIEEMYQKLRNTFFKIFEIICMPMSFRKVFLNSKSTIIEVFNFIFQVPADTNLWQPFFSLRVNLSSKK